MKLNTGCQRACHLLWVVVLSILLVACSSGSGSDGETAPSLSVSNASVTEGDSGTVNLTFIVSLSTPASSDVTVDYVTSDVSATAGSDYTAANGTLTILAGNTSAAVTVSVAGDTDNESNETLTLTLSNPVGATIATATATGTINDDDSATPLPTLSIADASIAEGDSGAVNLTFSVSLSAPASSDVTVDYATSNGTATAGSDYTAMNGTLTISAGNTSGMVAVSITGDTDVENNETLFVTLTNPVGAGLGTATATGTINNDDSVTPLPTLSIADASIAEGDSGTVNLTFIISLSAPVSSDVTVDYATSDGSATASSDYTPVNSSITIVAGNTNGLLNVDITGDTDFESNETLTVILSNPVGAILGTAIATGTINNDDTPPPTATVSPSVLPLGAFQDVVILFSESMNTGSVVLGGTLANDMYMATWSMTTTANDTLTLTPNTSWSIGDGVTLTVDGDDLDSTPNSFVTLSHSFNVLPGTVYYVSSAAANDNGDGLTPATARQTIRAAIEQTVSDSSNPATVVVNAGTYAVNSDFGGTQTHVVLVNGVSLYGGYNSDFSARNTALHESIVEDMSTAVVSNINLTSRALESGTGIDSSTVVDGFTLRGSSQPDADYISAVYVNNSTGVIIRNNQITGGSADFTYGVMVLNGATTTIENNTSINGGNAATNSHGIFVSHSGSTALIQNNTTVHGGTSANTSHGILATTSAEVTIRQNGLIHGGHSQFSYGALIDSVSSNSVIHRNRIFGGTGSPLTFAVQISNTSVSIYNNLIHAGISNNAFGVSLSSSNSAVRNNTIYAGSGSFSVGIDLKFTSAPLIDNNIIYSRSVMGGYCIFEDHIDADPASISNNNFSGCTATVYKDLDGGCVGDVDGDADSETCTLAEMEALPGGYQNNTADDATMVFVDEDGADNDLDDITDNDWRLSATTGNIANGGLNGIDAGGWGFADDFDGVARPGATAGNWSIGAYEHP